MTRYHVARLPLLVAWAPPLFQYLIILDRWSLNDPWNKRPVVQCQIYYTGNTSHLVRKIEQLHDILYVIQVYFPADKLLHNHIF